MTVKEEEAVVQAFIKMWKDVTKTGDKLNASQLDHLQKMMKSATTMISNNKSIKANTAMSNKQLKFDEKELKVRERLKKADEYLVNLRHKLNIEQEREHGDQVRRNINLRHNMDSFNDKFEMLKKSITGGFGFQAAGNTFVKKMGGMTRSFQELEFANQSLADATKQKELKQATVNQLKNHPDEAERKKAEDALKIAEKAEERAKLGVKAAIPPAQGTQGKMTKPIFEKLGKLGEFLGKKAVPIGIGVGVAGVLMSVIVKAFSASPLFAAMMKLMKFMVQLILMPIGTFFGALLRPILIMLLRKFIIPFYSKFMPVAIKAGGYIGDILAKMGGEVSAESIVKNTNAGLPPESIIEEIQQESQNMQEETGNQPGEVVAVGALTLGEFLRGIWSQITKGAIMPYAFGDEGDEPTPVEPIPDYAGSLEHVVGSDSIVAKEETEGERQVRLDKEERDRAALMESDQERTNRELAEAAAAEAERVAFEHADKAHWMELNRSVLEMNKLMETNGIITEAIPKSMTQEMTNFAAYGMGGKKEKGGAIHDAGISMTQAEIDKLNAGYQGYGGVSSTVLKGSGGRSSQSVMDNYNAYLAGVVPAADGFNGMVNSPTMFLAGEAGSEHVSITPSGESGGGITVNIQNMNGSDNDLRKLKQTILEVIQESSANRGRL
jgi:hypothetical protein